MNREEYLGILETENAELKKQLKAYENMRKEARIYIKIHGHYDIEIGRITSELTDDELTDLLNILNKRGDEK